MLASSLIPRNENAVYRVINAFTHWGAAVVHKGNSLVHVLGHAAAGELLFLYNIAKPTNVLPSTENDGTYALTAPTRLRRFGRIHRCR